MASGASPAHQAMTRATSAGAISGRKGVRRSMSVSTLPGDTARACTPSARSSSARLFVKPMSPHLEAL